MWSDATCESHVKLKRNGHTERIFQQKKKVAHELLVEQVVQIYFLPLLHIKRADEKNCESDEQRR